MSATTVRADDPKWGVGVWGGYATASMKDANDAVASHIDGAATDIRSLFIDLGVPIAIAKDTQVKLAGGMAGGIEATYSISPDAAIGARVGSISAGEAEYGFTGTLTDASTGDTYRITANEKLSASVVPVFAGIRGRRLASENLTVHGGVFAGMGFGSGDDKMSLDGKGTGYLAVADQSVRATVPLAGSGFGGEVLVGADYHLSPTMSVGLDVGYRLLKIASFEATKNVDWDADGSTDIDSGDKYKDFSDNTVPFDFSGLTAAAKLTIRI